MSSIVGSSHRAGTPAAGDQARIHDANYRHLVLDILFFGIGLAATARFLSVFGIRLGANELELSLIASLPALVLLFSSGFGMWWLKKFTNAAKALVIPGFFFRFLFLLPALAPFFAPQYQVWWLIIGTSLTAIPQGLAAIAFVVMMRDAVPESKMARLLSRRSLALNLGLAGAAIAFGAWLEIIPFPINYQLMFVIAFIFGLISWRETVLIAIKENPIQHAADTPKPGSAWRIKGFYPIIIAIAVSHIAFHSVNALIPLHLVDNLNATEGFIAVFGMVELIAAAGISVVTPYITRAIGTRSMMAIGMIVMAASSILIALSPVLWLTLIGGALSGAGWTMTAIVGLYAYFNERTTPHEMAVLSGPYHQVIGISMFIGPLIGSTLSGIGLPLVPILLIGSALRLIGAPLIDPHLFTAWRRKPAPILSDPRLHPQPSPGGD